MARINPITCRNQRMKLRLSLAELARRSNVDKGTIHRIENGRSQRTRGNVVTNLARALNLEPAVLTAAEAELDAEPLSDEFFGRSQMNMRISHEARNALTLVADRYGVRTHNIVELAPLMFLILAEDSLRTRSTRLEELRDARESIEKLGLRFPHISERLVNDWNATEIEDLEARSIARSDILGKILDSEPTQSDTRRLDYDDGYHNPFVTHLRERLGLAEPAGEFIHWYENASPQYAICKSEALAYFGGDEKIAEASVDGMFGMHEIPKELRSNAAIAERVEWAHGKVRQVDEQMHIELEKIHLEMASL